LIQLKLIVSELTNLSFSPWVLVLSAHWWKWSSLFHQNFCIGHLVANLLLVFFKS